MEQRYDVAVLLHQGRVYTDIMQEVNASSATISRVKRMLNLGTGRLVASIEQAEKEKEETNG